MKTQQTSQNQTCHYMSKESAPAGWLCGNLVTEKGKAIGQIRKTNDDEFTVYGRLGIVGKYGKAAFRFYGRDYYTSTKFSNEYTLI